MHSEWHFDHMLAVTWLVVVDDNEDVKEALTHTRDLGSKHIILAAGNAIVQRVLTVVSLQRKKSEIVNP